MSDLYTRTVYIHGIEDDVNILLGCGVELVMAVKEIDDGSSPDSFLTYSAKLTGEELLNFVNNLSLPSYSTSYSTLKGLDDVIKKDHHYIITADDD